MSSLIEPSHSAATVAKAGQLCCSTLFFYCCCLQLQDEVRYIWTKRWSSGKIFYFLSRYSGAAFLLYANITTSYIRWYHPEGSTNPGVSDPRSAVNWEMWNKICMYGHLYTGPGLLVISLAEVVLMLRVYALYEKNTKVLVSLVVLFIMSVTYNLYQTIGRPKSQKKFPCFGSCENPNTFLGCTVASNSVSYIGWLFLSLVELVLFTMVIVKYRQSRRSNSNLVDPESNRRESQRLGLGQGVSIEESVRTSILARYHRRRRRNDIMTTMARDSTRYFALIFTVCLLGFILAIISEIPNKPNPTTSTLLSQLNTYQTLVVAIMAFFAPQLVINVRKEEHAKKYMLDTQALDHDSSQLELGVQVRHESGLDASGVSDSRTAVEGLTNGDHGAELDECEELTWELRGSSSTNVSASGGCSGDDDTGGSGCGGGSNRDRGGGETVTGMSESLGTEMMEKTLSLSA